MVIRVNRTNSRQSARWNGGTYLSFGIDHPPACTLKPRQTASEGLNTCLAKTSWQASRQPSRILYLHFKKHRLKWHRHGLPVTCRQNPSRPASIRLEGVPAAGKVGGQEFGLLPSGPAARSRTSSVSRASVMRLRRGPNRILCFLFATLVLSTQLMVVPVLKFVTNTEGLSGEAHKAYSSVRCCHRS